VSTYFIAQISIHDPEEYEKYLSGFNEIRRRRRMSYWRKAAIHDSRRRCLTSPLLQTAPDGGEVE
jgi:hypothetical protein